MITAESMAQRITEQEAITAAGGGSWKWQLRDQNGQWIKMGSKVKWVDKGKSRSGKIVGSPKAGTAVVEDDDGNQHTLTTNRLTATEAPSAAEVKATKAGKTAKGKFTPSTKATAAAKSIADDIAADVDQKDRKKAVAAVGEYAAGQIAGKLPEKVRNLPAVQAIRVKGAAALKRLRTFFHTNERFEKVKDKAEIWADEFVTETLHAEGSRPGLWTAFHTLHIPSPFKEPVEFLSYAQEHLTEAIMEHGHEAIEVMGHAINLMSSGEKDRAMLAPDMEARIAAREAAMTAAGGTSWKWQLRDRNGQWVDMGALVRWMANGQSRDGKVTGSPQEGMAEVEEAKTKRRVRIASNRLTVVKDKAVAAVDKRTGGTRTSEGDKGSLDVGAVVNRKSGSQPEPDTVPTVQQVKGQLGEADTKEPLPPARPNGSTEEPRKGANAAMKKFFSKSRDKDGSRRPGRSEAEGAKGTEEDPIYVGNDVDEAVDLLVAGKHIRMSESPTVALVVQKLGPALQQAEKDIKAKYNIPKDKTALDYPEGSPERESLEGLGLNMCAIQVPGTNIFCVKHKGVPRISMPQLSGKDKETGEEKNVQPWAEEMLDSMKLIGPVQNIKADTVTASQSELGAIQIAQMLDSYKNWKRRRDEIAAMPDGPDKDAADAEFQKRTNDPSDYEFMSETVLKAPILVSKDGYIIDGHHRWAVLIADDLEDGGLGDVDMNVREVDMEIGESLATVNAFADAAGIARKAPKGAAAPKEVPIPKILQDAHVRVEIEKYIANNMDKILAKVKAGSKEGILSSAVREGNVLLALLASGAVDAHRVLRVVAETSGGRTLIREDVHTGALSLAIMTPKESVVIL